MVGRTNSSNGAGGLRAGSAIVHIVASVGSTITLFKNGILTKALDPSKGHVNTVNPYSADYYYSVPPNNFGEWGIASDTYPSVKQITITSNQVYDVNMAVLYLYDHGVYTDLYTASNVTSKATVSDQAEWIYIYGSTSSVQDGYKRWASVDLTHFNTITVKRSAYSSGSTAKNRYCAIYIADASNVVNVRQATIKTNPIIETDYNVITENTLDISNVIGTHYVAVGINTNGSSWNLSRRELIHEVKLS